MRAIRIRSSDRGCREVRIPAGRGELTCRYYPAAVAAAPLGCLWAAGAAGRWHSPAGGLYPRLARELAGRGISSLRVHYRRAGHMGECVADVLAGARFLAGCGVRDIALVGHSLGGAIVIRAAAALTGSAAPPRVRTVVTLATQLPGAVPAVARLPVGCSILLLHGADDETLPPCATMRVYAAAGASPGECYLLPGTGHSLDEAAGRVEAMVRAWIHRELGSRAAGEPEHDCGT